MEFPDFEQEFVEPSERVEPRCRTDDFSRGVQARTADPLWMLARQWQTGEFQGEDAGSPIHVQLRHSTQPVEDLRLGSGDAGSLGIRPLETAVEEQDRVIDFRERVRIGQEFERRLLARLTRDADENVARALVVSLRHTYAFPQRPGNGGPATLSDEDIARLDRATQRFVRFMQGRVVDGISVLRGLATPAGYEIHQQALDSVAGEIPGWRNSVCSTPDNKQSPAWQSSKLDYHFELNANAHTQPGTDESSFEGNQVLPDQNQASEQQIACADIAGFLDGNSLGSKFDDLGMQLVSLAGGSALLRDAANNIVFPPEGIRLTWAPSARGEIIVTISPISGRVREPIPTVHAYDAAGNTVASGWTSQGMFRLFRADLESTARVEIAGGYAEGIGHIYSVYSMCVREPLPAHEIAEGTEIGGFVVRGIALRGAPMGSYTLRQDGPTAGKVRLLRDGVKVLELDYNWRTTISFDNPYRFSFPCFFDIDIGKHGSGTRNLHGLNESFFDGNQVLRVQTQTHAPTHLVAHDYRNGEIDWYTFEAASAERGGWLPAASVESTPTRLTLASTSPRWWAFEDGRTYFGGLDVNRPDLAKMLLMEIVLINADDWFSVPLPVEMGRLVRICGLTVTNVFGDEDPIGPAREIVGEPDKRFELFTLSPAGRQRDPGCGDFIFVPPVAGFRIESSPIDEVHFIRDEGANMVWAIEHLVPNGLGRPVSGFDAQLERIAIEREADLARLEEELAEHLAQLEDETLGPDERKALEQQVGTLQGQISRLTAGAPGPSSQGETPRYRLATPVPENWIPFVPRARESHVGARHPRIQFQRAQMLRYSDATEKIPSQSRLLALEEKPLLWLNEESVLRAGVRVQLTKQRVRWVDGTTHVWLGRKVLTGRGEGASGLRFDVSQRGRN